MVVPSRSCHPPAGSTSGEALLALLTPEREKSAPAATAGRRTLPRRHEDSDRRASDAETAAHVADEPPQLGYPKPRQPGGGLKAMEKSHASAAQRLRRALQEIGRFYSANFIPVSPLSLKYGHRAKRKTSNS
jgi:hypothetical protein